MADSSLDELLRDEHETCPNRTRLRAMIIGKLRGVLIVVFTRIIFIVLFTREMSFRIILQELSIMLLLLSRVIGGAFWF